MIRVIQIIMPFALLSLYAASAHSDTPKPVLSEARFKVDGLSDQKTVKNLAKSLANLDGVVASKADENLGVFIVSYDSKKTTPETILTRIQTVVPGATLDGTPPTQEPEIFVPEQHEHRCGGCPMRDRCGNH